MKQILRDSRINFCLILFALIFFSTEGFGQTFSNYAYETDESNFANPERGFYQHTETQSGSYSHLNEETLRTYRNNGISLILRVFYLDGFVQSPISQSYLANMHRDFQSARAAGVKVIVRFAYTRKSTAPYGDATPEWAIRHVAQLKPVLHANADVIAVVQAGFVGAWGEWYYTDHFAQTPGNVTAQDWGNRRALVNALLDATPVSRAVQLRTPAIKFSIVESQDPITEGEAFTSESRARLGHHNDCFLASANDVGTYTGNMEAEKAFLEEETQYLPMGGETCGVSIPLSECPNALEQMKRFHWSYLNRGYHPEVLSSWEAGSCMPDVYKKLGYRFRLVEASLQEYTKPGGVVNFDLQLTNDGWASAYNERIVELILRNQTTGKILALPINADPRRWMPDEEITIQITAGIGQHVPEGTYELLINLRAPEPSIKNNPAYSVRLANVGTWEEETGYNKLNHTITVTNDAEVPAYDGDNFFISQQTLVTDVKIIADGNAEEWENVESLAAEDNSALKMFNDTDSIYFLLTSTASIESFSILIDIPGSPNGISVAPWKLNNTEFSLSPAGISKYENSMWTIPMPYKYSITSHSVEFAISKQRLGLIASHDILVAANIVTEGSTIYLPGEGSYFVDYTLRLPVPEAMKATSSGEVVHLYWTANQNYYRVIERSLDGTHFETIAVTDPGAITTPDYTSETSAPIYRSYFKSEDNRYTSSYGERLTVPMTDRPEFFIYNIDGESEDWNHIAPVSTANFEGEIQAYRIATDASNVYFSFEGTDLANYEIFLDVDNENTRNDFPNDWEYEGFDYLVTDESIFMLEGASSTFVGEVTSSRSERFLEISVPVQLISKLQNNEILFSAATLSDADGAGTTHFPGTGLIPVRYHRALPVAAVENFQVANSENKPETELVLSWEKCNGCAGYLIERSIGNTSDFVVIADKNAGSVSHVDVNLSSELNYYYRIIRHQDGNLSLPSDTVVGTPLVLSTEADRVMYLYPNPVEKVITVALPQRRNITAVEVVNVNGQRMNVPFRNDAGHLEVDVTAVQPGLYYLSIDNRYHARFLRK